MNTLAQIYQHFSLGNAIKYHHNTKNQEMFVTKIYFFKREVTCSLVLTRDAEKFNGQEIVLKLLENEPGTNYSKEYLTRKYQLRRQLADMDF